MSSTLLAYGTDGTQTPGFGSYNAGMMMYNVPHTAAQQAVYDTQQFTPRQHAGMQMMPSDVASTYFASDATGAAASSLQAAGQGSSASSNAYQHQNPGIGYSSSMSELQQQSSGANQGTSEGRDVSSDDTMAMKWSRYQRQLGTVFQDVKDEHLERASKTLLDLSNWLLPQVSQLGTSNQRHHLKHNPQLIANDTVGLHQDDANLHEERLKLWGDFNHGWLALAFKQKCLMTAGRQISGSQGPMTKANVQTLGDELVRLCDGLERHGLVDYQYGVAEEQIVDGTFSIHGNAHDTSRLIYGFISINTALEECLILFDKQEAPPDHGQL